MPTINLMTSSAPLGRRHVLRQAAVAALAGAGLFATAGPAAHAASRRADALLPPIAQTVNLSLNIFGASLVLPLPKPLPRLNFLGSQTVKILIGGTDFVRMQILSLSLEADHPLLGKVTLSEPDIDTSPSSILKLGPAGLIETLLMSPKMTIDRLGDLAGPLTFRMTTPAQATGTLTHFPPPPQGTNPDGSPTGGAFLRAAGPMNFTLEGVLPSGGTLPDLTAVKLQWDGVNEGALA
ncbi:hypothetical protein [Streptomyces sp. RPT161]|uniref:hypothetical protein n=1 Tax=Streptomyces sp. RPT161 TaxID=3015993 RepID=UPI0022B8824C|nr:hypothetical protein [Streptomyces sp. RPT161]